MMVSSGSEYKHETISWRSIEPAWDSLNEKQREWAADCVRRGVLSAFYFHADAEVIDSNRRYWARTRDEMLSFQKICGKQKDLEGARFFKQEAVEALKHYRGCCLVLGHLLCEPPGDSLFVRLENFPLELCDYAVNALLTEREYEKIE